MKTKTIILFIIGMTAIILEVILTLYFAFVIGFNLYGVILLTILMIIFLVSLFLMPNEPFKGGKN